MTCLKKKNYTVFFKKINRSTKNVNKSLVI